MVNFVCLQDWALLDEIPRGETPGGIALPDRPEGCEEPLHARVVKVGPGRYDTAMLVAPEVEEGDIVYCVSPYNPVYSITLEGHRYTLCRASSLVGKVVAKKAANVKLADVAA